MDNFLADFKFNVDILDVQYKLLNGVNVPFFKISFFFNGNQRTVFVHPCEFADIFYTLQSVVK